mgnify:CR=1 FL=1
MHDPRDVFAGARRELARFPTVLGALLTDLDPAAWRARPAPAEWAPVEIVCHLRDEEVEDFGARLCVVLAGGNSFGPIDPERWAVERRYLENDGPAALATFLERRAASLGSLASIEPARLTATVAPPHWQSLRSRYPGRLGRARPPAPDSACRDAGPRLGRALGAAAHGVRRADPVPERLTAARASV